jgi:hypothetical protein
MHKHILQQMQNMHSLRRLAEPTWGEDATKFLCEILTCSHWVDEARSAWKDHVIRKGYPPAAAEMGEDTFLAFITKSHLMALRHMLDVQMVTNAKREEGFPWVMMALLGASYAEAVERIEQGKPDSTDMLRAILLVEAPSGHVN